MQWVYRFSLEILVYLHVRLLCFVTHRVHHPNIVKLYEMYDDKSKVYLVMELWVMELWLMVFIAISLFLFLPASFAVDIHI